MKKYIKGLAVLMLVPLCVAGCGNTEPEEEVVFGDIDMTKEYVTDDYQAPSAVKRKDPVDIYDTFGKIPFVETAEKQHGTLPAYSGEEHEIDRISLNNIYFDINQIANHTDYTMEIDNGILNISVPRQDGSTIRLSVVQIGDFSCTGADKTLTEDEVEEMAAIIEEYEEIYQNTENQSSNEYGYYYTYDKYVDWMKENEKAPYNISFYDPKQVLSMAIDIFGLDKSTDDFYISTNADLLEVSDWYRIHEAFMYEKQGEDVIDISVKSSDDGVFLFMAQYEYAENFDENGDIYFTPTMIVNIAQNNYCQLAIDYKTKTNMENYENGAVR